LCQPDILILITHFNALKIYSPSGKYHEGDRQKDYQ